MRSKYTATDRVITRITGWIAGLTVIVLTIWGIRILWKLHEYEETNDAQVQEYVNPIISRVGGFIVAVRYEENQVVRKGDTLLMVDKQEYVSQQQQTEASIQKAIAQLQVLESNTNTLETTASAAGSQVDAGKVKIWKEQLDYDRYKRLYDEESATKQTLEKVQESLEVTKSEYATSVHNYDAARSRIRDNEAEKGVVKAEITRLRALLDRHKLDVGYTAVTAPYDGRIGRRTVEPGQMINAGEVLAYIVDNETDKWVVANFKETQVAGMRIGDSVKLVADAYPDQEFKGAILSFSPATGSSFSLLPPDNSTGNYVKIVQRIPVRIKIAGNRKDLDVLKVGMNVNVYFPKKQSRG